MSVEIAEASSDDIDDLIELNLQVHGHHAALYPTDFHDEPDMAAVRKMFSGLVKAADQSVLIARDGNNPAGYLWFEELTGREGTYSVSHPRLYVHHIGVAPAHRRRGIARRLMNRVIAEAGTRDIQLDSWARNDDAHAFFRAIGFKPMRVTFRRNGAVDR